MNQQTSGEIADHERDQRRRVDGMLRTTWFDSVTSLLMALMLFLGTLVSVLLVVWLLLERPSEIDEQKPVKIRWGSFNPEGLEQDFLEPGEDEVVDLTEPSMQDSLLAVTDAVSNVAASRRTNLINRSGRQGDKSDGDSRPPGPDGVDDLIPRFERWQLNFSAKDLDSYARQLDHYGTEIGLIGGGIQGVDYARFLSSPRPRLRHGTSSDETRLYFLWTDAGPLMRFDRQLMRRAFDSGSSNTPVENRQMLKFISQGLENQLAKLELKYARSKGHATIDSIAKTVFISTPRGEGYQFVVAAQRYRKPKD